MTVISPNTFSPRCCLSVWQRCSTTAPCCSDACVFPQLSLMACESLTWLLVCPSVITTAATSAHLFCLTTKTALQTKAHLCHLMKFAWVHAVPVGKDLFVQCVVEREYDMEWVCVFLLYYMFTAVHSSCTSTAVSSLSHHSYPSKDSF